MAKPQKRRRRVPPAPAAALPALRGDELAVDQPRLAEMIARGAPLPALLDALTRMIEGHSDGMLASILLLDPDGVHLRHGAAPSLPASYTHAIDGLAIGPDVGSCG